MVNQNKTCVVIILDKSGSMLGLSSETISGYNNLLDEQQKLPGECTWTCVLFDDTHRTVDQNVSVAEATKLSLANYKPSGYTALYDAIGDTVVDVGASLAAMKEKDRPGKVVFVVMTDGEENRSREYSGKRIQDMIKHQREKYNWEFVFMGCNEAAIKDAQQNLSFGHSASYTPSALGTKRLYNVVSQGLLSTRSGKGWNSNDGG